MSPQSVAPQLFAAHVHLFPTHGPLSQSVFTLQARPVLHAGDVPPAPPTSVSSLFFVRSMHVAVRHVSAAPVLAALHTRLTQSRATAQVRPSEHALQSGPPQSTAVSLPSFEPLLQSIKHARQWIVDPHPSDIAPQACGSASQERRLHTHTLPSHAPLVQSMSTRHGC